MQPLFMLLLLCTLLLPLLSVRAETRTWQTLCPTILDYEIENKSFLESVEFLEAYDTEMHGYMYYCPADGCRASRERSACVNAINRAGVKKVDVIHAYPKIPFTGPLPPKFSTTPEGTDVKIAYFLMVHENIEQVKRLLKAVYSPRHTYLIYVDGKASEMKQQVEQFLATKPFEADNVFMARYTYAAQWGSPELVMGAMAGMFQLLDISDWDFVINLSGSDYPLCNEDELVKYLNTRRGKNFDVAKLHAEGTEMYSRPRLTAFFCGGDPGTECYAGRWREFPKGIVSYDTSQWFIYSRDFVTYLRTAELPRLLLTQYEFGMIADEGYFGTVLMNSPFNNTRINSNLRHIVFDGYHPKIWSTDSDLEELKAHSESCFTRKFAQDSKILDDLDNYRTQPKNLRLP